MRRQNRKLKPDRRMVYQRVCQIARLSPSIPKGTAPAYFNKKQMLELLAYLETGVSNGSNT